MYCSSSLLDYKSYGLIPGTVLVNAAEKQNWYEGLRQNGTRLILSSLSKLFVSVANL